MRDPAHRTSALRDMMPRLTCVARETGSLRRMAEFTVAACVTAYWKPAHADVIVTKLLEGYELYGEWATPRVRVASLYIDQFPSNDIGRELAAKHGVPIFGSIGEAIGVGRPGVNVDGVILIGEHGEYGMNDIEQDLYPRRRFFEAAVAAMVSAGRFVPIFNDKHLAYDYADAEWMYRTAKRLAIPFLAGSTIPLAWRQPALEYPLGIEGLSEALVVAYGPIERYGYHALEGLQAMVERRAEGETGVAAIQCLEGAAVWESACAGRWSRELLDAALATIPGGESLDPVRDTANPVAFLIEYSSGLRGTVILLDGLIEHFAYAARRNDEIDAVLLFLQDYWPYGHFTFLIRQIESMVMTGVPPYPIERTLLTTGLTDYAMRSRYQGQIRLETPMLDITYTAPASISDTGLGHPLPWPPQ